MTPSNANTSGLEVVQWEYRTAPHRQWHITDSKTVAEQEANDGSEVVPRLVRAASAQARIAELEAERDQIAGESIWWKAVIGDEEYTPSGEVPSIKHLHPATVKPIFEAHKGSAVADVIAGLIFSRAITENREQFLVRYHIDRATAAEARADRLARLGQHTNWELSFCYLDGEDEDGCWAVHSVNGGRNDREWTVIGRGETPDDAISAALQQETQP